MDTISEEEKALIRIAKVAYCAGIVDGEGCLFVHHSYKTQQTLIHLIVSMSDQASVAAFPDTFGCGKVAPQNRQGKLHHRYCIVSDNAARVVREMLPFLKGKKEQAELFLIYYEVWKAGKYKHHGRRYDILDAIEAAIEALRVVPFTFDTPPAETEREDSLETEGCDSPSCIDGKDAESTEMIDRLN